MEIQGRGGEIKINVHGEMTCNVVLILLRYYTYAHIHAHRDIEGSVYVCVLCCVAHVCLLRVSILRDHTCTREPVRARTMPCVHVSRARMYVYV